MYIVDFQRYTTGITLGASKIFPWKINTIFLADTYENYQKWKSNTFSLLQIRINVSWAPKSINLCSVDLQLHFHTELVTFQLQYFQLSVVFLQRWIKFEEKVEKGGERWSKPHVATLSLHSLFELRTCIEKGTIMLDLEANTLPGVVGKCFFFSFFVLLKDTLLT